MTLRAPSLTNSASAVHTAVAKTTSRTWRAKSIDMALVTAEVYKVIKLLTIAVRRLKN